MMAKESGNTNLKGLSAGGVAVIALAAITLIGIAVVSQFGYTLRTSTSVNVTDFNVTLAGSAVTIGATYPFAQSLAGCYAADNVSNTLASTLYTIDEGTIAGEGADATFTLAAGGGAFNNTLINCTSAGGVGMTYRAASTASASADTFNTGLAIFATFIGVVILALMGKIVVNIFRKKN